MEVAHAQRHMAHMAHEEEGAAAANMPDRHVARARRVARPAAKEQIARWEAQNYC